MNTKRRVLSPILAATGAIALSVTLTACGGASSAADAQSGELSIVASTSVYGQIAAQIAGDAASVTSIIDSSVDDPHSYEASARDRLAVSRANLVIVNGGGYDSFMSTLLADDTSSTRTVLDVSELSGLLPGDSHAEHDHAAGDDHTDEAHTDEAHTDEAHAGDTAAPSADAAPSDDAHDGHDHIEGFNEHLWYNFDAMRHLAEAIEADLSAQAPEHAALFAENASVLESDLSALEARTDVLAVDFDGTPVAVTEPVPLYLLEAAGLHNETPAGFSEAIEEGDDVAPRVLQQMIATIESPVALLAYNEQTASPQTELVRAAAAKASVPVVDFAETLPEGSTYISWMNANIDALTAGLAEAPTA